jgi:ATP-binding cassette subfamily C protein CydD
MAVTAPFIPLFYIIFGLKTRDESKEQMTYLNQFSQRFLNGAVTAIIIAVLRCIKHITLIMTSGMNIDLNTCGK